MRAWFGGRCIVALPALLLALAGSMLGVPAAAAAQPQGGGASQELLVTFARGTPRSERAAEHARAGATVVRSFDGIGVDVVRVPAGRTATAHARYGRSSAVTASEPNSVRRAAAVPNDPEFPSQWGLADAKAGAGWDVTTGSGSTLVAVIDSGVDVTHPDLAANIWRNPGEVAGNGIDDDGNGYADDVNGWDFAHWDASVNDPDDTCPGWGYRADGHGTHVAGIIGAVGNNGTGVSGVAWRVKILPLKFLSGCGEGWDSDAIAAIAYAVRMGARVINISWGGPYGSQALGRAFEAARDAGVAVAVAAGNSAQNLAVMPDYPASYGLSNQIVVAASDRDGLRAEFSNYGGPTALAAPGVDILSTLPDNLYGHLSGTSMATPFVTGALALLRSQFPAASVGELKDRLLGSVTRSSVIDPLLELLAPVTSSGGRLDIGGALGKAPAPGGGTTPGLSGYWMAARDGGIFSFGNASFHGSTGGTRLVQPIVAMAPTPSGEGYWLVASDGGIFAFGDAAFHGSTGAISLVQPIVGMTPTPTGQGYWLVAADGGMFAFGDAGFYGSTGGTRLVQPIVAMAATRTGKGYWLVAADGGIFAFGDAAFHGSTGGLTLAQPIVGMAPTPSGTGYWLTARDGGMFAYGDAAFHGSTGAIKLNKPIISMAPSTTGKGYWLVASDGGIFSFGDATFLGSTGDIALAQPIVALAVRPRRS